MGFFLQSKAILIKQLKITLRNPKTLIAHLLTPLLMVLLVFGLQAVANDVTNDTEINPPFKPFNTKVYCSDCTTIGYGILGDSNEWIDEVIKGFEKDFNLKNGTDIQLLYQGKNYSSILQNILEGHKIKVGVIFCNTDLAFIHAYKYTIPFPCKTGTPVFIGKHFMSYAIIMDKSGVSQMLFQSPSVALQKDGIPVALKISIDNSIAAISKQKSGTTFEFYQEDFPKVPSRLYDNYNVLASEGAFYFMIPSLFSFLVVINEILKEKEYKQRLYLNVLGVGNFVYYFCWFVICLIYSFFTSLVLILSGMAFGFRFFIDTNFIISIIFFTTFTFSMQLLGIFICATVKDQNAGKSVAYAFILISGVIELFTANVYIVYQFYFNDLPSWFLVIRTIFDFYPPFNYTKIFGFISTKSGKHFDVKSLRWINGPGFTWSDLTESTTAIYPVGHLKFKFPSVLNSYIKLLINCGVFLILIWYFDHVVISNRGIRDSFFFFIPKNIRSIFKKCFYKKRSYSLLENSIEMNLQDNSPFNEKIKVEKAYHENKEVKGIRIFNLSKTYSSGFIFRKELKALKNITFEVQENELIALLGHNGAGKTTLINVLIGITEPNEGKIFISGLNAKRNKYSLRKSVGICPQFDILWNDLTITDHIRLVAMIKGISDKFQLNELTQKLLEDLDLYEKRNTSVKLYSGGMRRRTALGLSTIGNPKVIFMDEPTTGMDPLSRRKIWNLISEIKIGKAVILTTHSMEEADVLSDKIIVMAKGVLKSIGTSLYLKKMYGEGYKLTIYHKDTMQTKIKEELKKIFSESQISTLSAGTLHVIIPFEQNLTLKAYFKQVENGRLKELIDDWGLTHSTIEEAFLKITKKSE